jgi:hypothetical protein
MTVDRVELIRYVTEMSEDERRATLVAILEDLTRLTIAIKEVHPLAMGKGDGAIDTAIHHINTCTCRDGRRKRK